MEFITQTWAERDLTPLVENETDLILIKKAPASQVELFKFVMEHYEISAQEPLGKIFLDITLEGKFDQLYGNTNLEWHIDKGYSQYPANITGLFALEIEGNVGGTQFVDNRIECPVPNKTITVDIDRFTSDDAYGYKFRTEIERRYFRRKYRNVQHDLIQRDKKGEYVYYCQGYTELPEDEKQAIEKLLYDPSRIYTHKWEQGDFVIYNNITTNHRRDRTHDGKRHLWKIEGYNKA